MNKTKIEWVKNPDGTQGYTWNPITGCLNNCSYCYAKKLANGRLKSRYLANENTIMRFSDGYAPVKLKVTDPFYPRFWEDRLDDPYLVDRNICIKRHTRGQRRTPRGIFVCDMGELFGDWVPREWQEEIHMTITLNPQHRFYLLTKQPQNLLKFSPFPDNCWVGFTATDEQSWLSGLERMQYVNAKVKFVSFEPLLSEIGLIRFIYDIPLNWVIIGGQTKPAVFPKIEWVQEILVACHNADIPVFMKNNLRPLIDSSVGWGGWKLRQEMPGLLCRTG